ncbi:hypothetical protein BGM26_01660 [Bacillus sp. FJAT-29790]|uniref:hypothetical protein n=1 Tax=Bacillus sp. FJAT-29790 TaxID=1895002 RepID=UPI001C2392D0|nr:hypothetical protein [Bacillus sp. FJAT-29790]MBU8877694.1 hypothetical protein [Bacillus sp. FJAT-29790]
MRRAIYLFLGCLLLAVSGCHKEIPEPEVKIIVQPVSDTDVPLVVPVSIIENTSKDPFYVRHQVKGREVLIECIIQGVTFRESNTGNRGKMILYVDGKKREEIDSAAFIVRGLSPGTHRLKLEVVKANNTAYKLKKEFYVTIP